MRDFQWGEWDCFAYIFDGRPELIEHLPPRLYTGPIGAARYFKRLGFDSLPDFIDSLLTAKPVGFAQRGDVLLKDGCLGICHGPHGTFLAESGFVRIGTFNCERAWSWDS